MPVNLRKKRELAARTLGVGIERIKFDPNYLDDIADAITREDIRSLVTARTILVKKKEGTSRGRFRIKHEKAKKRGRGKGSMEGKKTARTGKKEAWVRKVRTLRKHLKIMKDRNEIDKDKAKLLYRRIKGGQVRSVAHLRELAKD
ncbi:MAG: 50S ribosomal protein L19e [Candidatus Nitrosocaldaceae archaeon]|jgi:large subunit ribosomal protein L19e|nr:MAG: 50S ribosomal protein L19e [Candidatus Nitrosocaldaceae archaeon]